MHTNPFQVIKCNGCSYLGPPDNIPLQKISGPTPCSEGSWWRSCGPKCFVLDCSVHVHCAYIDLVEDF